MVPAKNKGLADVSQPPALIGGANRDRTGDLYNAIVEDFATRLYGRLRSITIKL
jgi:hypothetical protein